MPRRRGTFRALLVFAATLGLAGCAPEGRTMVVELVLRGGALPADQQVIRLRIGDDVTLRWRTDRPITIHLHGYDIQKTVGPGGPTTMSFKARATGRFPISVHKGWNEPEATLGYLEVYPW